MLSITIKVNVYGPFQSITSQSAKNTSSQNS